jgi:hypothetical protein
MRCNWLPGELWWGNFSLPHHVYNNSPLNRVHLVMDVEITPAILRLFPSEFVKVQASHGIAFRSDGVNLTDHELHQFECDIDVPSNVFPHAALRSGGVVRVRVLDHRITMTSLSTASAASTTLKLEPIARDEFAIVGWSHAVTVKFSLLHDEVASAMLVIRGLPKKYMRAESEENPRVARNEIPLQVVNRPAGANQGAA